MLAGQLPECPPAAIDLELAAAEFHSLSHFQRAALIVIRTRLQELEQVSRSMFALISDIKGCAQTSSSNKSATSPGSRAEFVPDPDRLLAVFRIVLTGLPGGDLCGKLPWRRKFSDLCRGILNDISNHAPAIRLASVETVASEHSVCQSAISFYHA